MNRLVPCVAIPLLLASGLAMAVDKTSPDFLRGKHAGTATLHVDAAVQDVFANILSAAQACYVGKTDPSASGIGGAAYSLAQAQRIVVSELEPGSSRGYVAVRAVSGMAMLKANFIQFDVSASDGSTRVDVYYRNNVEFQKASVDNAKAWLDGDLDVCKLDRIQQAARQRTRQGSGD